MEDKHCDGSDFDFLIGKSIEKVEEKRGSYDTDLFILTCNDNTVIEIETNNGCGGCGNGWSSFDDLKKLENNHNVITNVVCKYVSELAKEKEDYDMWDYCENYEFKLFVYYQDDMLTLEGDDGYGNGYYGGGFYVTIKDIEVK